MKSVDNLTPIMIKRIKKIKTKKRKFDKSYVKKLKKKKLKAVIFLWMISNENKKKFIYKYDLHLWIEDRI